MSTDCRIFVLSNALMKVSGCIPDIICIAQITWKIVNNTLLINNWRLDFFGSEILPQFLAHENWLQSVKCAKLRSIFSRLDYPMSVIDSAIKKFLFLNSSANKAERNNDDSSTVRISLPFKDQVAANAVRKRLRDLSHKIGPTLQPMNNYCYIQPTITA